MQWEIIFAKFMKRFIAFILVLSHMNTSMFLPQVPEDDQYDAKGNQLDDINSVVEFVLVKIGIDKTADDEDDDCGQNFHIVQNNFNSLKPVFCEILQQPFITIDPLKHFPHYRTTNYLQALLEILTPPPKVC